MDYNWWKLLKIKNGDEWNRSNFVSLFVKIFGFKREIIHIIWINYQWLKIQNKTFQTNIFNIYIDLSFEMILIDKNAASITTLFALNKLQCKNW